MWRRSFQPILPIKLPTCWMRFVNNRKIVMTMMTMMTIRSIQIHRSHHHVGFPLQFYSQITYSQTLFPIASIFCYGDTSSQLDWTMQRTMGRTGDVGNKWSFIHPNHFLISSRATFGIPISLHSLWTCQRMFVLYCGLLLSSLPNKHFHNILYDKG